MAVHLRSVAALLFLPVLAIVHRGPGRVRINDNRRAAGTLRGGLLTAHLEARRGMWRPDGDRAPAAEVPAFAEAGKPPEIPGPLIRVPAPLELRVGVAHRVRLINITKARPGMRMELLKESADVEWRVIAKDGAELPATRAAEGYLLGVILVRMRE